MYLYFAAFETKNKEVMWQAFEAMHVHKHRVCMCVCVSIRQKDAILERWPYNEQGQMDTDTYVHPVTHINASG